MRSGFGQDPMWAYNCMAQGGIPDYQIGCVPAPIYPSVRQCVDGGGVWDPYIQACVPAVGQLPPAQGGLAETVARVGCAAMGGVWDPVSNSCGGPNIAGTYGIDDFQNTSLPATSCPPDKPIPTPLGCQPWPSFPGTQPPAQQPPAQQQPPPGYTPTPEPQPSPQAASETPAWLAPVVIGIAGVAVLALVWRQ